MSSRVRVYELARELGLTSSEMMELLQNEGVEVKSHASAIDDEVADLVRDHVISRRQEARGLQQEKRESSKESDVQDEAAEVEVSVGVGEDEEEDADDETEISVDKNEIHLKPPIVVRDLAEALGRKPNELIGELMTMNVFAAINQVVEIDVVEKICERHGFKFIRERRAKPKAPVAKQKAGRPSKPRGAEKSRPPVVTFLGHVDHGKTSLQDAIRKTKVVEGEAGGITQHIGASTVQHRGHQITFLDTPGHEAFTAMRARGANATDIAVVVVAADDGVMPQTVEAIDHAKAAKVPIVVAMNKMDLPGANPERVLVGLQQHGINPEDWGGDVGVIPVSAITEEGLDDLLERILLEAEMLELRSTPSAPAEGLVIEAQLEAGMGPTAHVLVRNGTLHVGDIILCGQYSGKVKALLDDNGNRVKEAGPSCPVKIMGLSGVPEAGQKLEVFTDERDCKRVAEERASETRQGNLKVTRQATLEDLFKQIAREAQVELNIVIKTDVRGSAEAIIDALRKIPAEKIKLNVVLSGVGEITDNDVLLAAASDAIVIGFHVRAMPGVNRTAKANGVEIRLYSIIYELLEDIEDAMRGRLEPEIRETPLGKAEILQVIKTTKAGKICGCRVQEGSVRVGIGARVFRENELIYRGNILSLRRFQDDVREVRAGNECGIRLDNFEDFEVGDRIECYVVEKVASEL